MGVGVWSGEEYREVRGLAVEDAEAAAVAEAGGWAAPGADTGAARAAELSVIGHPDPVGW